MKTEGLLARPQVIEHPNRKFPVHVSDECGLMRAFQNLSDQQIVPGNILNIIEYCGRQAIL